MDLDCTCIHNSDHSDTDSHNFGAQCETSSLVTAIICHNCLNIVQVKLYPLKIIVNKLPCPKCQGEFLKIPVANVANMFNASLYICMKHMGLPLNYGIRNICID